MDAAAWRTHGYEMSLEFAAAVLHGIACVLCLAYAYARRRSQHRQAANILAVVWFGWLVLALLREWVVNALPPPGPEPLTGLLNRTLLALDTSLYLAWPFGILAWILWTFRGLRPRGTLIAWILASIPPIAFYPKLGGDRWFHYAAALHIVVLYLEIDAIFAWIRRRKPPAPWHVAGFVAAAAAAFPAIPFLASSEARAGYLVWVLRGLVTAHLAMIAIVGGDLWPRQPSRGPLPS